MINAETFKLDVVVCFKKSSLVPQILHVKMTKVMVDITTHDDLYILF